MVIEISMIRISRELLLQSSQFCRSTSVLGLSLRFLSALLWLISGVIDGFSSWSLSFAMNHHQHDCNNSNWCSMGFIHKFWLSLDFHTSIYLFILPLGPFETGIQWTQSTRFSCQCPCASSAVWGCLGIAHVSPMTGILACASTTIPGFMYSTTLCLIRP